MNTKELEKRCNELFFQVNEKTERNTELEKENAELKERNAELKGMYAHSAREAGTYKQFLELKEKENAELLEKLKNQKADYETYYKSCYNAQKKSEKQLTKAKEIIKKLIEAIHIWDCKNLEKVETEAENFLKGDEGSCQDVMCEDCNKERMFKECGKE